MTITPIIRKPLFRWHCTHTGGGRCRDAGCPSLGRRTAAQNRCPVGWLDSHLVSRATAVPGPYTADQPIPIPPPNVTLNHFRNASKATAKSTPAEPIELSLLLSFVIDGHRSRLLLYRSWAPPMFHEMRNNFCPQTERKPNSNGRVTKIKFGQLIRIFEKIRGLFSRNRVSPRSDTRRGRGPMG